MNDYKIRLGKLSDFDQLYEIYMDESVNRFLNFEIMDKAKFRPLFEELLKSGELYVFEKSDQIVATCIVMKQKRRADHVASLGTLATHPQFQNKGMGTQFMRTLFQKLKEQGIKRVDLCVEADNPIAYQFYKKLGFQQEGLLKKYFKRPYEDSYIDEVFMALIF